MLVILSSHWGDWTLRVANVVFLMAAFLKSIWINTWLVKSHQMIFLCATWTIVNYNYITIVNYNVSYQRRQWHPTPVLLPGKSHGQRSLVGCSPWGCEESDKTEWLSFHFSLSCTGEGSGNPFQCSCLENPRDGEIWWAAVYGVAQSWTRLKRRSSSSNSSM